jgi:hypothetical protein
VLSCCILSRELNHDVRKEQVVTNSLFCKIRATSYFHNFTTLTTATGSAADKAGRRVAIRCCQYLHLVMSQYEFATDGLDCHVDIQYVATPILPPGNHLTSLNVLTGYYNNIGLSTSKLGTAALFIKNNLLGNLLFLANWNNSWCDIKNVSSESLQLAPLPMDSNSISNSHAARRLISMQTPRSKSLLDPTHSTCEFTHVDCFVARGRCYNGLFRMECHFINRPIVTW